MRYPQKRRRHLSHLDVLFVIGLPRSGTSLVHNLIHRETGRKAPTFKSFGIDTSSVPRKVRELNKTFRGDDSLAEDNDFPGYYPDVEWIQVYREWLQVRGTKWVLKSPEHLANLPILFEVFPEAHYLWCIRPAAETLASIREYWQVAGVGPPYPILPTVDSALHYVRAFPERFDCIFTPSIPEFESDREPAVSPESEALDSLLQQAKGACRNVTSSSFRKLYS